MIDPNKHPIAFSVFNISSGLFIGSILGEGILLCMNIVPSHREFGQAMIYIALAAIMHLIFGEK